MVAVARASLESMKPIEIIYDAAYGLGRDAELSSKCALVGFTSMISTSDLLNLWYCQLGVSVIRAYRTILGQLRSAFHVTIRVISPFCAKEKMFRIDTSRVVTSMQDTTILGVNFCINEVGEPMSQPSCVFSAHLPVTERCFSPEPVPTFIRLAGSHMASKVVKSNGTSSYY